MIKDRLSLVFLQLYLIWWGILLFISSFNPFGLYPVTFIVYGLILLSISCFSIGFILNGYSKKGYIKQTNTFSETLLLQFFSKVSKSKVYLSLLVFFSLFIYYYLLKYQKVILLYGTEDARLLRFYVGNVFSSNAEIYFYNYFVETFSIVVSIYLTFSIVLMKFTKAFYLSMIFLYLYSSFGAGRGILIELGFYILFLYLIKGIVISKKNVSFNELKLIKKRKLKSLLIILPVLLGLYLFSIYLSNFRKGLSEISIENFITGNEDFFSQIIIYCVGSFRALEYGINNFSNDIGYTYGSLSFGGIDEFIFMLFNFIGFQTQPSNFVYGLKTNEVIMIGYNQSFNALYTNIFGQYLDFGILGVILLSFFWGVIFNKSIHLFYRTQSIFSLALVLFFFVTAIISSLSWKLQSVSSTLIVVCLYLIRNNRIKKNND